MKTNEIIYVTWEWDKVTQHYIKHTTKLCSNCGEEEHMITVLSVYLPTLFNEPYKTYAFGSHSYAHPTLNAMVSEQGMTICVQETMVIKLLFIYYTSWRTLWKQCLVNELMTLGQISTETGRPRRLSVSLCLRLSISQVTFCLLFIASNHDLHCS